MPKKAKTKYTKTELKKFIAIIEKEHKVLLADLDFIKRNSIGNGNKGATGDNSAYSHHMADQGTDAQEREKAFLFASRETQQLERLKIALERIEDGVFGVCVECEELIGKERLLAVPTATLCVRCKTERRR